MSDMKEKYLGESKLSDQPKKKINFILGDKVVTTSKIADKSVTPEKLSKSVKEQLIDPAINAAKADLQNRIDSIQVGGLALSNEFGDSTTIGISQKTLTEEKDAMYELIAQARANGTELLPFSKVESVNYPLWNEERSDEGIITYMENANVFALYIEDEDDYYVLWTETENRKGSSDYNIEIEDYDEPPYSVGENEPVYTVRKDKLFYYEVEAEDLLMKVDETLSISSTNPVTNSAISKKFNQVLEYIDEASGFKKIYNISYVGDSYEDFPDGDEYHTYALEEVGILYEWNSTTGEWGAVDREAESRDIVIYKGKIGYLYPDELEWQADTNIPENYRTMVINGILPSNTSYIVSTGYYEGEGGDLMLDLSKEKVVLRVTNGNRTIFYDKWTTNGSRLSSDSYSTENNIYVYIEEGKLHIGVVKDNTFIEMSANATVTVDNALSPNSSNPVKNSVIYNKFNEVSQEHNFLSSIVNNISSSCLMPIDGIVTEEYDLKEQQGYGGSDGKILIDEANARIILFIEGIPNKGYTEWGDAGGRHLSSEYDIHNQFFWLIDDNDTLHIYKYLERDMEVESSEEITPRLLRADPQIMPNIGVTSLRKLVEVASSSNVVIDKELSATSTNPVENQVITNNISSLSDNVDSIIEALNNKEKITFYPIAGVLSSDDEINRAIGEYSGYDGVVVLYPGSVSSTPEILLAVDVDTGEEITTEYYSTWKDVGLYPGSSSYEITDWNTSFFVWESGRGIHVGKTSGVGEVLEIVTPDSSITIDNALSVSSSNPIANSTITSAFLSLNSAHTITSLKVTALEGKTAINGTPLLHFDGFVSELYTIPANDPLYKGTGGSILYDRSNTRFVLKVSNRYYSKWEEASDKAASTNYTVGNILVWNVLEDGLHIYYVTQDRTVKEVTQTDSELNAESANPIANNVVTSTLNRISNDTIHTIYVKGENSMAFENPIYGTPIWEPGLIWYNQDDDDGEWFKICTKVTQGVPTFEVFTPKDSNLFYYGFDDCSYYTYVGNSELMKVFDSTTNDTVEHLSEVEIQVLERLQDLEERVGALEPDNPEL